MRFSIPILAGAALIAAITSTPLRAADTTPVAQLSHWSTQAGSPGNAERGRIFFVSKHGKDLSCASCHGETPMAAGKHASTGKTIAPLAPAANPDALTDTARINKWLKRNCNDVLSRECSAQEKADVMAFLISLKR